MLTPEPKSANCAGTIVVLIDESDAMASPIAGGTRSKAEGVATAVNSMLNQLAAGPSVRVALVAYGGVGAEGPQSRWAGPLQGRSLVASEELPAAPVTVEDRIRRIPGPGGMGVAREETIRFPVWYVPQKDSGGTFENAMALSLQILVDEGNDSSGKPPLLLHLFADLPAPSRWQAESVSNTLAAAIGCHLHLGTNDRIPATLYPSSSQHLATEDVASLFNASPPLPGTLADALRTANVPVSPGARGMVYQAAMGDLIRFLLLAKAYAASGPEAFPAAEPSTPPQNSTTPPPAPEPAPSVPPPVTVSPNARRLGLLFLVDRSLPDSSTGVWSRRQQQVNEMIGQVSRRAGGNVDVGLIVYDGTAVEIGFHGPAEGRTVVADVALADVALRVDQVTEKVSNGIGGLIEVTRQRPVFLECEPGPPVRNLGPALDALAQWIAQFRQDHEQDGGLPIVMHVTGADFPPEEIAAAARRLTDLGDLLVYHAVVPNVPQRTVAYPATPEQIPDPQIASFWQMTSLLAGAEQIGEKRRTVTPQARGFVVGARFDLLPDSIQAILEKEAGNAL